MKGMTILCRCGLCFFAISCCIMFTGLVPVWGQPVSGFSQVHFDGTFLYLGQHILDTSDIGVLLQRTNPNFKNLSKSNGKDISWDSDGVRYTEGSKDLKITWVLDPDYLHYMDGHPTHLFKGKSRYSTSSSFQTNRSQKLCYRNTGLRRLLIRHPDITNCRKMGGQ